MSKVAGLRRFGAASLDLAYVAAGRLDGVFHNKMGNLLRIRVRAGYRECGIRVSPAWLLPLGMSCVVIPR